MTERIFEWNHPPELLQWDITGKCNLECKHCRASGLKGSQNIELEQITNILDQLLSFSPDTMLAFVGGDPLMRSDLKDILAFAREKSPDAQIEILTNGTLITKKNVDWLADLADGFNISLEGSTAEINNSIRGEMAFERTLRGISLLRSRDLPVAVRMTFFHQPEEEVENLMRFLPQIGVDNFNFRYLVPVGRAVGQKTSAEQYKRLSERVWQLGKKLNLNVGFSDPFPEILVNPEYQKSVREDKGLMEGKAVAGCSVGFQLLYI